jgi:hypothetical protein
MVPLAPNNRAPDGTGVKENIYLLTVAVRA